MHYNSPRAYVHYNSPRAYVYICICWRVGGGAGRIQIKAWGLMSWGLMYEELSSGARGVQAVDPVSDAVLALEGMDVGSCGVASAERAVFVACSPPVL